MKILDVIQRILNFLGIKQYKIYLYKKNLDDLPFKIIPKIDINIKKAKKEDIQKLIRLVDKECKKQILYSIQNGSECYIATHNDEPAGFVWLNQKFMLLRGRKIGRIKENKVAFAYHGYVFPKYRNKRIFESLTKEYYKDLKIQRFKRAYSLVDVHNPIAIKARERFGETRIKRLFIITLPFNLHIKILKNEK